MTRPNWVVLLAAAAASGLVMGITLLIGLIGHQPTQATRRESPVVVTLVVESPEGESYEVDVDGTLTEKELREFLRPHVRFSFPEDWSIPDPQPLGKITWRIEPRPVNWTKTHADQGLETTRTISTSLSGGDLGKECTLRYDPVKKWYYFRAGSSDSDDCGSVEERGITDFVCERIARSLASGVSLMDPWEDEIRASLTERDAGQP